MGQAYSVLVGVIGIGSYLLWKMDICNVLHRLCDPSEPVIITRDKNNWQKPHQLFYAEKNQNIQLDQLDHFDTKLKMCYVEERTV